MVKSKAQSPSFAWIVDINDDSKLEAEEEVKDEAKDEEVVKEGEEEKPQKPKVEEEL